MKHYTQLAREVIGEHRDERDLGDGQNQWRIEEDKFILFAHGLDKLVHPA